MLLTLEDQSFQDKARRDLHMAAFTGSLSPGRVIPWTEEVIAGRALGFHFPRRYWTGDGERWVSADVLGDCGWRVGEEGWRR